MCQIYEQELWALLFVYVTYSVVIMYEMPIRNFYSWLLYASYCSYKHLTLMLLICHWFTIVNNFA